jgi:hypothetical protein
VEENLGVGGGVAGGGDPKGGIVSLPPQNLVLSGGIPLLLPPGYVYSYVL